MTQTASATDRLSNSEIARLRDFRRRLHRMPEVSGQERETAARVVEMLRTSDAEDILTGLGGHGVAAIFEGAQAGPTVMLRAELDALPIHETNDLPYRSEIPGIGHMCGHDGHSAALLGCAFALSRRKPARGRVVLMFQPAEETGAGAAAVIADPRFAKIRPDFAFAWHNMPGLDFGRSALRDGPMFCASVGLRVTLTGRTAHAAEPEAGLSPAGALARLIEAAQALGPAGEDTAAPEDFRLVTITHARLGEPCFGIAPGEAEFRVTLRAALPEQMAALRVKAEALARRIAAEAGLDIGLDWQDAFAPSLNHPEATAIVRRALDACDVPHTESSRPVRASEDFGRFGCAGAAKTAMFLLGSGQEVSALHNPDFDFPDGLIAIGARVMVAAAREIVG